MPIISPESGQDIDFFNRLQNCGAVVIDQQSAYQQDIRPARIGLLNLMPASVMEATELRWLRFISHTVLQVEPVLLKFDNDCREQSTSRRKSILERYQPLSTVVNEGLDGLIITGDNQELRNDGTVQQYDELLYSANLRKVIDWADDNVNATIFSCLAGHFALNHRYGLSREFGEQKILGVYDHQMVGESPITFAMDDSIKAPHSRWGSITAEQVSGAGVEVLATNENVGWLIAEATNAYGNTSTYLQGHPEYWRSDLHDEYVRDMQTIPENYYPNDDPTKTPILLWSNDARSLLSNWIQRIYTNYST
ncbi:MAG: homoserine O-succinyltransferase [bacterium]|nr:homoserine O-succinyltransferase [bacterium]